MKNIYEPVKELFGGIALMLDIPLIISLGIKWILVIILIPLLLLFTFLGIDISFNSDVLSTRVSILSFFLALGYLVIPSDFWWKKKGKDNDNY